MKYHLLWIEMLCGLLLVGCASLGFPAVTSTPAFSAPPISTATFLPTFTNQEIATRLDTMMQKLSADDQFSGSLLVARNGQIILSKGYGMADRENKIPNTPQTRFRVYSLTKAFTAVAIMILQEQGKLSVQDRICLYLTDCPESWQSITIHHLLTHSSGITTEFAFTQTDFGSSAPLEEELAMARKDPLGFSPGLKFSYSNIGYTLLGQIIEKASGQTYEAFLQMYIFDPLKLADTGYDHNRADLAKGYTQLLSAAEDFNMWALFGSGCLYSTTEDIYRWDQALYTTKLLPQKALDQIFTRYLALPEDDAYGFGYSWIISSANGRRSFLNYGSAPGYFASFVRYPDEKVTIIILENQEDPNDILSWVEKRFWGQ